jgi:hypothetical protein
VNRQDSLDASAPRERGGRTAGLRLAPEEKDGERSGPLWARNVQESVLRQCCLIVLLLAGFSQFAQAKPRSSQADTVLDQCKWAAQVEILSVTPAQGKGLRPRIEIRVSDEAAKVYRGTKAGAKLSVQPLPFSNEGTLADLGALVGTKKLVLMAVNKENQVEFVGQPKKGKQGESFRLRSWYDFNAWWIYSTDKKFGTRVELDGGPMQTLDLSVKEIRERLK